MNLAEGYRLGGRQRWHDIHIPDDHRRKSIYIVGDSGSGKTRMALSHIQQDIRAGRGFTLFDNQGQLYRRTVSMIAQRGINPDRLVLIDPVHNPHPIPLNPLAPHEGYHPHTIVEQVLYAFRSTWRESWGDRMEDILRNALLLLHEHRLTINELPALLMEDAYRKALAEKSQQPIVKAFFLSHLAGIRKQEYRYWIESSRNKVNEFVANPYLQPMIAADKCFDFQNAMAKYKIVLVYLPKNHLHDSGSVMGKLIISRLFTAALSRMEWDEAPDHHVVVDEFQDFATSTLLDMVTQTRKRGIGLTLMHQNLNQPPFDRDKGFLETILANVHSLVVFAVSRPDAERLAKEMFGATGDKVKKRKKHWLWGEHGEPKYWSVQEEWEHYYKELEDQQPRECFVKLKGTKDPTPYVARSYYVPDEWEVEQDRLDTWMQFNWAWHGISPDSIKAQTQSRHERLFPPRPATKTHKHAKNAAPCTSAPHMAPEEPIIDDGEPM